MRNMSFQLTTKQIRQREKRVTRRLGWKYLRAGDLLQAVEKCQGLKKGEHIKKLCVIEVISERWEALSDMRNAYGVCECIDEGFPNLTPEQFIEMFCKANNCKPYKRVHRIEFKYV